MPTDSGLLARFLEGATPHQQAILLDRTDVTTAHTLALAKVHNAVTTYDRDRTSENWRRVLDACHDRDNAAAALDPWLEVPEVGFLMSHEPPETGIHRKGERVGGAVESGQP